MVAKRRNVKRPYAFSTRFERTPWRSWRASTRSATPTAGALVAAAELDSRPRSVAGGDARKGAECHRHVFHVKWNAKGTRPLVVVRARWPGCPRGDANHALTVNPGGEAVRVVATWLRDGNHPNWLEDGRLSMNYEGKVCAFDDVEGASCQVLSERASGHPVGVPGRGDLGGTETYAKEHAAVGLEAGELGPRDLVVISPYNRQCDAVRGALARRGVYDVRVGTVDAFQGQETQLVVFTAARSNPRGDLGFLRDPRRRNVAITRAKRGLVLVGDAATLSNSRHWRALVDSCRDRGAWVDGDAAFPELELC